jgi:hypothetical protein
MPAISQRRVKSPCSRAPQKKLPTGANARRPCDVHDAKIVDAQREPPDEEH